MISVEAIIRRISQNNITVSEARLQAAYDFAVKSHEGQKRLSGEPYVTHPVAVAFELAKLGADEDTVISGLLHDVLEDTSVTDIEIYKHFGEVILFLVKGVTNVYSESPNNQSNIMKNYKRFFQAITQDLRILTIKLVDRLHNMRTLHYVESKDKQTAKAEETLNIYAPLADYIGLFQVRNELYDLSVQFLEKENFEAIKANMDEAYASGSSNIDTIMQKLGATLSPCFPHAKITGRLKTISSVWFKMKKQNITFDQLSDIIGFRILVENESECYLVHKLLHKTFEMQIGSFKDYIKIPKNNGYRSLHSVFNIDPFGKVEIQIRTVKMHHEAEMGIAHHAHYKKKYIQNIFPFLEKLIYKAFPSQTSLLSENLKRYKREEIYCYTPSGDIIFLPKNSSCLDFAHKIHSQVGWKAVSAKVNGRVTSLATQLRMGDEVHIDTQSEPISPSDNLSQYVSSIALKKRITDHFVKRLAQNKINFLSALQREKMKYREDTIMEVLYVYDIKDHHYFWHYFFNQMKSEIIPVYKTLYFFKLKKKYKVLVNDTVCSTCELSPIKLKKIKNQKSELHIKYHANG